MNLVSELRVAFAGGERVRSSLAGACDLRPVPVDWSRTWLREIRPHLLLVEGEALGAPAWVAGLPASAAALGVPSTAWLTESLVPADLPAARLRRFDRVFVTHPLAVPAVAAAAHTEPLVLPEAACARALACEAPRRLREGVGYVGGYSSRWEQGDRTAAQVLLHAAARFGLQVFVDEGQQLPHLPSRFAPDVRVQDDLTTAVAGLEALVVLTRGEDSAVPAVVFDALALGVPVLLPPDRGVRLVLPRLTAHAATRPQAERLLAQALHGGPEERERRAAGRAAVHHAHTYPHRLATVASALGHAVVVGAPEPSAFSSP